MLLLIRETGLIQSSVFQTILLHLVITLTIINLNISTWLIIKMNARGDRDVSLQFGDLDLMVTARLLAGTGTE